MELDIEVSVLREMSVILQTSYSCIVT